MNYSTSRDKNNPHWISLFRHVRQLNDKLVEIANFYLGNYVMARITDDGMLPKATSNIADACLEVTDATCVVMATMRSILHKHKIDNNEEDPTNLDKEQKTEIWHSIRESTDGSILIPAKEMNGVLSFVEIALLLSKTNKKGELEVLLSHTVSMIQKILHSSIKKNVESIEVKPKKKESIKSTTTYEGITNDKKKRRHDKI